MNLRYFFCLLISTCCNFLFGYHLVALNNYSFISEFDVATVGLATSMFSAGGLVGSALAGLKLPRITLFLICGLLCALGSCLQLIRTSTLICVGRVLVGMGCGIGLSVSPIYVAEITPSRYRGIASNVTNFVTVFAICISSMFGYFSGWTVTAGFPIFIALFIIFGLLFAVESPKYVYYNSSKAKAIQCLSKIRSRRWNIPSEMLAWEAKDEADSAMSVQKEDDDTQSIIPNTNRSILELFRNNMYRKHLLIVCALHALQQLSGMNVVYYYSTFIFREIFPANANLYSLLLTVFNIFSSVPLFFIIEKYKRQTLLRITFLGAGISHAILCFSLIRGVAYLSVISMLSILAFFNMGIGLLPFLLIPELFDLPMVGYATFIAVSVNWLFNIAIAGTFLIFLMVLKEYVFLVFMACTFFGAYIVKFIPETRNLTSEQVVAIASSVQ